MRTRQEILESTKNDLILLAQLRNAINQILISDEWKHTFIDELNFKIDVVDLTYYMIDDRYFSQFHTASDLNYFIQQPYKYLNEINICKLFDLVCDMAFGTQILEKHDRHKTWDIFYIFEKFVDNNIDVHNIIEYIDDEIVDELLEQIDDYS